MRTINQQNLHSIKGVPMNTKHYLNPQGVHMKTIQPLDKKISQGAPMFLSSLLNNVLGWLINCFMVVKNHFNPTSTEKSVKSVFEDVSGNKHSRKVRSDKDSIHNVKKKFKEPHIRGEHTRTYKKTGKTVFVQACIIREDLLDNADFTQEVAA